MNSCDNNFRNERDLRALLTYADKSTSLSLKFAPDSEDAKALRQWYETIVTRRASEDAGRVVK